MLTCVAPCLTGTCVGFVVVVCVGQVIGRRMDESGALRLAAALEAMAGFRQHVPDYVTHGLWPRP